MQEILAKGIGPSCGAPPLTSPTSRGELSRRLPSDWEVQNNFPVRNGLVGNSRICLFLSAVPPEFLNPSEFTGLRTAQKTFPCLLTNAPPSPPLPSPRICPNPSRPMPPRLRKS